MFSTLFWEMSLRLHMIGEHVNVACRVRGIKVAYVVILTICID
jgi:hypothetical protein